MQAVPFDKVADMLAIAGLFFALMDLSSQWVWISAGKRLNM
jgi:hypothetical protein